MKTTDLAYLLFFQREKPRPRKTKSLIQNHSHITSYRWAGTSFLMPKTVVSSYQTPAAVSLQQISPLFQATKEGHVESEPPIPFSSASLQSGNANPGIWSWSLALMLSFLKSWRIQRNCNLSTTGSMRRGQNGWMLTLKVRRSQFTNFQSCLTLVTGT